MFMPWRDYVLGRRFQKTDADDGLWECLLKARLKLFLGAKFLPL